MTRRRLSTAGIAALPDSAIPSASAMLAIVDAVPIVLHEPGERDIEASASTNSSADISPAFTASENRHRCVPEPTLSPRKCPFSIGPPETRIAGRSTLAAPISSAGVVLSQPASSTTPSMHLPRIASSTSMAQRLRYIIAVGRNVDSDGLNTGNSTGSPPAS